MEPSSTREATSSAANREIPSVLWNPNVRYRILKSSSIAHVLNQINPGHITSFCHSKIHLNYTRIYNHLRLVFPSGFTPSLYFPNNMFIFSIPSTCPSRLILSDLVILITLGEKYTSRSFGFLKFHFER
jgi:hypothetical protein